MGWPIITLGHLLCHKRRVILLLLSQLHLDGVFVGGGLHAPGDQDLAGVQLQVGDLSLLPSPSNRPNLDDIGELILNLDRESLDITQEQVSQFLSCQQIRKKIRVKIAPMLLHDLLNRLRPIKRNNQILLLFLVALTLLRALLFLLACRRAHLLLPSINLNNGVAHSLLLGGLRGLLIAIDFVVDG